MAVNIERIRNRMKQVIDEGNLRAELQLFAAGIGVGDMFIAVAQDCDVPNNPRTERSMAVIYMGTNRDGSPVFVGPTGQRVIITGWDVEFQVISRVSDGIA